MNATKKFLLALSGFGMIVPAAGCMPPQPQAADSAEEGTTGTAIQEQRRRRHNQKWRRAKQRARDLGRRGARGRDIARDFERSLRNDPDIVINVCVINAINNANAVADRGSDAVVTIIQNFNCEFEND